MRYKLIIFDFDCTLSDSLPVLIKVLNQAAHRFGFNKVPDEDVEKVRTLQTLELIRSLGVPLWKVPLVARHMQVLMAREIRQVSLFSGVDATLQALALSGARLAVVSSNSVQNVSSVLGPENLALIEYLECGVAIFGKSARIRKIIRRSGVGSGEAIAIGDETRDIRAAKEIGIASGAVLWGFHTLELLQAELPTEIFTNFEQMVERLSK